MKNRSIVRPGIGQRGITCPWAVLVLLIVVGVLPVVYGAVPYIPPAEELILAGLVLAPNLTNTEWEGPDLPEQVMTRYRFEPGGRIALTRSGTTYRVGSWQQTGSRVQIELNNRYCEVDAEIRGNTITGEYLNIRGVRWRMTLKRVMTP
jgi:hypothetical protein